MTSVNAAGGGRVERARGRGDQGGYRIVCGRARLPLLAVALCLVISVPARAQTLAQQPPDTPQASTDVWVEQRFDNMGHYVPGHYEKKKKPKFMGYFAPGEVKNGQRGYPLPAPDYGQNASR